MKIKNHLSIVVPCYNEEKNIEKFYNEALKEINKIHKEINIDLSYSFVFINDGSEDNTLQVLKKLEKQYKDIYILNFSRNFGKEAAILAGLQESKRILDTSKKKGGGLF